MKAALPLDQRCGRCGRAIDWDEYACNWGWCGACLDADYTEYLRRQMEIDRRAEEQ